MTVVLAGVGADGANLGAHAPLYDDGTFEYVPIPEKTADTTEPVTLGDWTLADGRTAADLTDRIDPYPEADAVDPVAGDDLAEWPLHRDPNFEALTYGEHRAGFGAYVQRLAKLDPGDAVGFYTSLRRPGGDRVHRYLVGGFAVASVTVIEPDDPAERVQQVLDAHPDNAHGKRAAEGGRFYDDKRLVIVDGRDPGGLVDANPVQLSEYRPRPDGRGGYYLDPDMATRLDVVEGSTYLTRKPALVCDLAGEAFLDDLGL